MPPKLLWHRLAAVSGLSAVGLGAYGRLAMSSTSLSYEVKQDASGNHTKRVCQVRTGSNQQTSSL